MINPSSLHEHNITVLLTSGELRTMADKMDQIFNSGDSNHNLHIDDLNISGWGHIHIFMDKMKMVTERSNQNLSTNKKTEEK